VDKFGREEIRVLKNNEQPVMAFYPYIIIVMALLVLNMI
jgi:hypothetical protein